VYLPEPIRRLRYQYVHTLRQRQRAARRNAPPLPLGAVGGPPDFVGLGAQKAGTSWWFTLLMEHPRTAPSTVGFKELNFFEPYWQRPFTPLDQETYYRHFPTTPGTLRGEWTPEYLLDAWCVTLLRSVAPDARLLVLVRDPIERFRSGLTQMTRGLRQPDLSDLRVAYQRGCYLPALEMILQSFPRESLLVLQYERCRIDPMGQLRRTFAHLGLEDHPVPASKIKRPVNRTDIPKVEIEPAALDAVRQAYRPQVHDLTTSFPELDLELWPNFQ
jgi:hypothetical protein